MPYRFADLSLASYDKRLGAIAVEVAEQTISLADDNGEAEAGVEMPSAANPNEEIKSMSYDASPRSGSSIGLVGDQGGAGTLGAFLRIVTDGTPKYFAMTCSHVLSSTYFRRVVNNRDIGANIVMFGSFQGAYHTWQRAQRGLSCRQRQLPLVATC